jgi:signal transduction histidine kinase/ActR/RegA family two-component response regulator
LRQLIGRGDLAGAVFLELLDSAVREQPIEVLTSVLAGGALSARGDVRLISTGESERWAHVTLSRVQGGSDEEPFLLAMVADISERKLTERRLAALSQAEKLRALGQMASGVAHDLNQYLGLVSGHGELALLALDEPTADLTRLRESLGIIVQAAFDGADAVRRLQAFARSRPEGPPQPVDVAELLREVAKLTAPRWRDAAQQEGRPIALHVETEGDSIVEGWAESLREAFTNLVFNAVDALPAGGTIWLVSTRRNGEVQVIVADDGVGMSPEVQTRVFEPFFTTKGDRGSGLGLSLVYTTVERHHGRISIDSAPGRGTAFRIVFPSAGGAPPLLPATHRATPPRRLRILAVDDDPALASMLALMLQSDGHEVLVASSGEEALRALSEHPVDIVLSDLGLGAGMNGWELADEARQRFPSVRIALATGWGAEIDEAEARRRGVDAILPKPYRLADLRTVLAAALAEE